MPLLKLPRYRLFLMVTFVVVWIWAAVHPVYPDDWLLENYLIFLFVPIILVLSRAFRLSDLSYTLITLFLCMHVIGSHYTYSEVPFGFTLQEWFGSDRNMYDRLVHFGFGLLIAYPIREAFYRVADARSYWGDAFPVVLVLACSASYEILEWLTAANVDPAAGLAFLGAQGDVWDGQKDMFLAGLGAVLAMLVVTLMRWSKTLNIWHHWCKRGG
jgi:putative membrane protein